MAHLILNLITRPTLHLNLYLYLRNRTTVPVQ